MKTIYLCGGINALSDKDCKDWREKIKKALNGKYQFLDPMRRDYRGKENMAFKEIVQNDLADIRASDFILTLANRPGWGTAMETFYAKSILKKPIILICNKGNVSPWLRFHSDGIVQTTDEAIGFFLRLNCEEKKINMKDNSKR